jgi:hypothetical protein
MRARQIDLFFRAAAICDVRPIWVCGPVRTCWLMEIASTLLTTSQTRSFVASSLMLWPRISGLDVITYQPKIVLSSSLSKGPLILPSSMPSAYAQAPGRDSGGSCRKGTSVCTLW